LQKLRLIDQGEIPFSTLLLKPGLDVEDTGHGADFSGIAAFEITAFF